MSVVACPCARAQFLEQVVLDETFGNRLESPLVGPNRERRQIGQFVRPVESFGEITRAVYAALLDQLFGGVHTEPEKHVTGDRPAELVARAFDRPLIDGKTELRRRNAESTRDGGHSKIARESELRSGSHRGAIDRCERDAREPSESAQGGTERRTEFVTLDTCEVGAGAERGRLARQHHDARTAVDCPLVSSDGQQALEVDGIASVRTTNRDDRDVFAVPVKRDGALALASRFGSGDLYHRYDNMASGSPSPSSPRNGAETFDPVRARRQQVAKWSLLANRIGYLLYAVTITCFVLAFAIGFNTTMVTIMTAGLVAGSVLLAPSIVLGYAVKAAEREDRENNR